MFLGHYTVTLKNNTIKIPWDISEYEKLFWTVYQAIDSDELYIYISNKDKSQEKMVLLISHGVCEISGNTWALPKQISELIQKDEVILYGLMDSFELSLTDKTEDFSYADLLELL